MYKLLIVDDEPKIREIIREYAEFAGYEVDEAEEVVALQQPMKLTLRESQGNPGP